MMQRPKLITFDFGDTLVSSTPPYMSRISMGLEAIGHARSVVEVEAAFHRADLKVCKGLAGKSFQPIEYVEALRKELFRLLNLNGDIKALSLELTQSLASFRPPRVLVEGARELLETLKAQGYTMGIISNNDGRTAEKCKSVEIDTYMSFILDSTLEDMMKPDTRFFLKALDLAGVQPEHALHVGDLWGSDVMGSRSAGMWSAWLSNDYINPDSLAKTFKVSRLLDILSLIDSV